MGYEELGGNLKNEFIIYIELGILNLRFTMHLLD